MKTRARGRTVVVAMGAMGVMAALGVGGRVAPASAADEPLQDASKLECDWSGCDLVTVTDAAKAVIEQRKDHTNLVIRFSRDSTDADLVSVKKLPWLKRIDLHDNITDLTPLAKLTHLEEVVLVGAEPKSLAPLEQLPALRRLDVTDETDLAPLRNMKTVRELHVGCSAAACVALLAELSWVTSLSVRNGFTPLDKAAFAPLAGLVQLEELSLMSTALTNLALLGKMTKLRKLNLQGNAKLVDIEGLRQLPALEELTIQNGNGARKSKVLFELPNLQTLFVEETLLSAKDKKRLKKKRPNLTII